MKFLVDMPLSPKTVKFLKNMGYEAIRVSELGMAKSAVRAWLAEEKKLEKKWPKTAPSALEMTKRDRRHNE